MTPYEYEQRIIQLEEHVAQLEQENKELRESLAYEQYQTHLLEKIYDTVRVIRIAIG